MARPVQHLEIKHCTFLTSFYPFQAYHAIKGPKPCPNGGSPNGEGAPTPNTRLIPAPIAPPRAKPKEDGDNGDNQGENSDEFDEIQKQIEVRLRPYEISSNFRFDSRQIVNDFSALLFQISTNLVTLQTCLTKLMGKPITMDQLRTDAGEMVEKITHVIMMFRKLDIKVSQSHILDLFEFIRF